MKKLLVILCLGISAPAFSQSAWTSTATTLTTLAKVGVGTNGPTAKFHVVPNNSSGGTWLTGIQIDNISRSSGNGYIFSVYDNENTIPAPPPVLLFSIDKSRTFIPTKLQIGSTAANGAYANYKLSVDGDMIAKRCVIQIDNWADYVFEKDYDLLSLGDVEKFVAINKHLPGVPSEAEVKEKGIEVGEMNKILMQKVEELTLYIIDLKKEINLIKSQQ